MEARSWSGTEFVFFLSTQLGLTISPDSILPAAVHRCQTIPFVCREFRYAHLRYPPRNEVFTVDHSISPSFIDRFINVAASVKELQVHAWDNSLTLLPQLLDTAAHKAPNLQAIIFKGKGHRVARSPVIDSLVLFSQVKRLCFESVRFTMDGDPTQMQRFLSLRSLEVAPNLSSDNVPYYLEMLGNTKAQVSFP